MTVALAGAVFASAVQGSRAGARAVAVRATGAPAAGDSGQAAISANGRFVAFDSTASNLVAGDTNGLGDVFVRDLAAGATTRVSVSSGGRQPALGSSQAAAISADGRFVFFQSSARNLVAGDRNSREDVFVRDRLRRTTALVSLNSQGRQLDGASVEPAASADGRFVAFSSLASNLRGSNANHRLGVFVRDRLKGTTAPVSVSSAGARPNAPSGTPAISADGRFVAFASQATNLVAGDTNKADDIFVRDRVKRTTTRVNLSSAGGQANGRSYWPAISADGRFVAFVSAATNLVDAAPGDCRLPVGSRCEAVFVRDRIAHTTERISVNSKGQPLEDSNDPAISADGRFVAFSSYDRTTKACRDLQQGDHSSDCYQLFLRDRAAGTTTRVSLSSSGEELAGASGPALSPDGRFLVFEAHVPNLASGGPSWQVFLHDRTTGTTTLVSVGR